MCEYITLIAPCADPGTVGSVMARHGRAAIAMHNPSVSRALKAGECQYLTTRDHCDCGTALLPREPSEDPATVHAREVAKLKRKGWSQAKIGRAMEGRRKSVERSEDKGPDSLALWAQIIGDLSTSLKLDQVGLLVHSYSGAIADEAFTVSRREAKGDILAALQSIRADEILVLRR